MASSNNPLANREIIFEPNFDIESCRGEPYTGGLRILDASGLKPLFTPPDRAYPRVVRVFYNSFRVISGSEFDYFQVKIDGQVISFTYENIAEALKIPSEYVAYKTKDAVMIKELNVRPKLGDEGNVRTSYLHEDMFLVDIFFKHVLCPVMHKNERPSYVHKYLHGLFKKSKIDFPMLFGDIVDHVLTGGRKNANPPKLAYPRFITAILGFRGYRFKDNEECVTEFSTLDYDSISRSLRRLAVTAGIAEPPPPRLSRSRRPSQIRTEEEEEEEEEEEHFEVPDAQLPHFTTRSEYDHLNRRMDVQDENIAALSAQLGEMYYRQEVSLERRWGDDAATIFSDARTRFEQATAARRARRAARNSNQGEGSNQQRR